MNTKTEMIHYTTTAPYVPPPKIPPYRVNISSENGSVQLQLFWDQDSRDGAAASLPGRFRLIGGRLTWEYMMND